MDKLLRIAAVLLAGGQGPPPAAVRRWEQRTVAKGIAAVLVLVAVAFGIAAGYLALAPWIGPALAAVAVAGILLVLGGIAGLVALFLSSARRAPPASDPLVEVGTALGQEFGKLVERRPLTALSLAFVAGLMLTAGGDLAARRDGSKTDAPRREA